MFNRPIYFLKLINYYCNFILKVNDVQIFVEKENGNISSPFPINEYLNPEGNIVTVDIFPMKGQTEIHSKTSVEVTLEVASVDNLSLRENIITDITPNFEAYFSQNKLLPASYNWNLPIKINIPFKDLHFYRLTPLIPDNKLLSELSSVYQKIFSSFENKNIEEIRLYLSPRIEDKSKVRFQTIEQLEKDLYTDLSSTFNDTNNELFTFEIKDFILKAEYGNKLFSLIDKFGDPPILYYNESIDMTFRYPMRLGKIIGNETFSVVR